MKRYEKYLSVTVANDVNDQLVWLLSKNADVLPGVSVKQIIQEFMQTASIFPIRFGYIGSIFRR